MCEIKGIIAEIDRFDRECSAGVTPGAEVVVLWAPDEPPGAWIARHGEQATVILLDTGYNGDGIADAQTLLAALFEALGIAVQVREVEVAPDELAGEVWNWEEVALAWLAREWPERLPVNVVSAQRP